MAIPVEMPKMSDTMEEGVVVSWMVEEGQEVSAGDVIAQVETDKATMDLEVYDDGVLLKRVIEEGDAVPIGGLIAILGKKDEDVSDILERYAGGGNGKAPAPKKEKEGGETVAGERTTEADEKAADKTEEEAVTSDALDSQSTEVAPRADGEAGRTVRSSPLARKLARDHGIELAGVKGSGPEGRIIKRDIESRIGEGPAPERPAAPREAEQAPERPAVVREEGGYDSIRLSQMRKSISKRLSQSKFGSPHFYLTVDLDMERAIAARGRINELAEEQELARVSYNDLITKACALALREHRWVNASYLAEEGEIRLHHDIHVAIAVAIDDGLITPVIRHADRKGLSEIAAESASLSERARAKELQPEEYGGSTFTTSNLGMFGVEEFTAIINPPNSCILAIGAIRDVAVVKDGAVVPGKRMKLTLSCDHRVVDGATGSRFLATVSGFIEDPLTMLL
jgi:pyruvate dehydrogenase E2 component (dihydrolipoamide acetyltransferase)